MQISQTPRPVSPIQTQISRTSRSTPSFRIHNGFNSFSTRTEKNSPSNENSSKGRRKSTQTRPVTFTVFCLGQKDTKNIPGTEKKLELLLAGLGEKRITFPFTDSNVEFKETMLGNYPMLKDIKFNAFRGKGNAKEMVFIQPPSTGYRRNISSNNN